MDNFSTPKTLTELFTAAAREIIERNRIKAQMDRILTIMTSDMTRLKSTYAELGKMYLEGTIEQNAGRVEVLSGLAKHLEARIERAKERYDQLKNAHSVDECTEAFKRELQEKVKKAQATSAAMAQDITKKAKATAKDLSQKAKAAASESSAGISAKIAELKDKKISKSSLPSEDNSRWEDFSEAMSSLDDECTDFSDEYSEDEVAMSAEIGSILDNIASALGEIDRAASELEEKAETADSASEEASEEEKESSEPASEVVSEEAKESSESESPESFTF